MNAQQHAVPMTRNQEVAVQQGALQQAILKATTEAANKSAPTILPAQAAANHNIPMVIPRVDLLLNRVVFLANTLDRDAETVQYMDLKKGGKPQTASLAYYKSTKPVKENADAIKMVNEFAKHTGTKELVMRERLIKASAPERANDGSVSKESLDEWKNKLVAALTKVILEI